MFTLPSFGHCLVLRYLHPSPTCNSSTWLTVSPPCPKLVFFWSSVGLSYLHTLYSEGCHPEWVMLFYSYFSLEAQNIQKQNCGVAGLTLRTYFNLLYCYLMCFECLFLTLVHRVTSAVLCPALSHWMPLCGHMTCIFHIPPTSLRKQLFLYKVQVYNENIS